MEGFPVQFCIQHCVSSMDARLARLVLDCKLF